MAIVRLDKVQASYNGNLESVKHSADMSNGSVVNLGALVAGETELHQVAVPATATLASEEVLLVASPELMYDSLKKGLADFTNKANVAARAYHLVAGDVFTVTDDMITGASVVGQYVSPQNGSLLLAASAGLPSTRFIGKVIAKETLGFSKSPATVIKVVKA